jgi:hypothetical protein
MTTSGAVLRDVAGDVPFDVESSNGIWRRTYPASGAGLRFANMSAGSRTRRSS